MKTFALEVLSPAACTHVADALNFIGTDASGRFGLRARHERFITALLPGLARIQRADGTWTYLAQPGASLRFADGRLTIATRDYVLSRDHAEVLGALEQRFAREDAALASVRENLLQLEREMLRRLWQLERA